MREHLPDHLANERTFLAWLRTSVAIIAFGFVLERFSLFLRYLAPGASHAANPPTGLVGAALIWLGTLLIPLSLWRYLSEQRNIDRPADTRSANWPIVVIAVLLASAGLYLAVSVTP